MSKEILLICAELGTINEDIGDHISDEEIEPIKSQEWFDTKSVFPGWETLYKEQFKRNTDHLPDDVIDYLRRNTTKEARCLS